MFVVGAVTLELALGMGIALFLNQRLPGRRVPAGGGAAAR